MAGTRFEHDGGHPALDFVNTLDERLATPVERLPTFEALVHFVVETSLLSKAEASRTRRSSAAASATLKRAITLREALHRTLGHAVSYTHSVDSDLGIIAREILRMREGLSLQRASILNWTWRDRFSEERPLWELAAAIDRLITSSELKSVRKCAAVDCGTYFLDTSRARQRRWCSMANCGNRNKVRRFRRN